MTGGAINNGDGKMTREHRIMAEAALFIIETYNYTIGNDNYEQRAAYNATRHMLASYQIAHGSDINIDAILEWLDNRLRILREGK
jgi:hypothetical protein